MERIQQRHGTWAALQAALASKWVSLPAPVVGCCLLVGAAAQVRIPLPTTDVPMTVQSLAVLLTGLALSPSQATAAMVMYLGCGTLGLPLFAAGSGGLLGPTGGYLVGFLVAAWVVSVLKGTGEARVGRMIVACVVGMLVLFTVGVGWRIAWLGGDVGLAILTGLAPFVAKASIQVFLAPFLVAAARGLCRRRG